MKTLFFDYFGVLAHGYGRVDTELMNFIEKKLVGKCRLAVLSNMNGGINPGRVIASQNRNSSTSRPSCHARMVAARGLIVCHMVSSRLLQLLLIALEHFAAQDIPDAGV